MGRGGPLKLSSWSWRLGCGGRDRGTFASLMILGNSLEGLGKLDGTSHPEKDFLSIFWIFSCQHLKYLNDN